MRYLSSIIICSVTALFLFPNRIVAQERETLRLKAGAGPIEAKLLSWDFVNTALKVELADGAIRELAVSELHSLDMRKIDKILGRQMQEGRKSFPQTGSSKQLGESSRSSAQESQSVSSLPNGFNSGFGAFSSARGSASGGGSAMASSAAGGFGFGGPPSNAAKKSKPPYPASGRKSSSDSSDSNSANEEGNSESAFSGMLNLDGKTFKFDSPEEFERAMKEFRAKR